MDTRTLSVLKSIRNILRPTAKEESETPALDTSAYAAGDLVGDKMTFSELLASSGKAVINGARLEDLGGQAAELAVILFKEDPTNTTLTDNAALDVADADLDKIVGTLRFRAGQSSSGDYEQFDSSAVALLSDFRLPVNGTDGTLYAVLKTEGSPTYGASDLTLTLITE
jgi:hypothetical protein